MESASWVGRLSAKIAVGELHCSGDCERHNDGDEESCRDEAESTGRGGDEHDHRGRGQRDESAVRSGGGQRAEEQQHSTQSQEPVARVSRRNDDHDRHHEVARSKVGIAERQHCSTAIARVDA